MSKSIQPTSDQEKAIKKLVEIIKKESLDDTKLGLCPIPKKHVKRKEK